MGARKPVKVPALGLVENRRPETIVMEPGFNNLPKSALEALEAISSPATYPAGAVLYVEGQEPRGVFMLGTGRVKLSGGSSRGRSLIVRIAQAGEIIGLPGTLSNRPYEVTAEALEQTQANFIRRKEFVAFLRAHGEAALRAAEMLSNIYHATYQEVRYLGLASSATERLARFLLDLTAGANHGNGHRRAELGLTHEEIGEMIGVSRETVSRLVAAFKRKNIIEVSGSVVHIKNQVALEEFVEI